MNDRALPTESLSPPIPTGPKVKYIVYLRPEGPLREVLEQFYHRSLKEIGRNEAHGYLPHCSLTGFFQIPSLPSSTKQQDEEAVRRVIALLRLALQQQQEEDGNKTRKITEVKGMFAHEVVGLSLKSPFLCAALQRFARLVAADVSEGRLPGGITIPEKNCNHISLGYRFSEEDEKDRMNREKLLKLVEEMEIVKIALEEGKTGRSQWRLGFYARKNPKQSPEEWMAEGAALWQLHCPQTIPKQYFTSFL